GAAVPRPARWVLRDACNRLPAASGPRLDAQSEDRSAARWRRLPHARDAERLDAARWEPADPEQGRRLERLGRSARGHQRAELPPDDDRAGRGVQPSHRLQLERLAATAAPLE